MTRRTRRSQTCPCRLTHTQVRTNHTTAPSVHAEEKKRRRHTGGILRKAGAITVIAVHGSTFYVGDFALVCAEQGPACMAQLVGLYSVDLIWVRVPVIWASVGYRRLATTRRARWQGQGMFFLRRLLDDLPCFFFLYATSSSQTRPRMYHSTTCSLRATFHTATWDERELLEESAGIECETCAFMLADCPAEVSFSEEAQTRKPRAFHVFAGAGAMNLGMEAAACGMKTTRAVEIVPSAARTFKSACDNHNPWVQLWVRVLGKLQRLYLYPCPLCP